jgi:hypothetical protein
MTIKERSLFKNCGGGWVKQKEMEGRKFTVL